MHIRVRPSCLPAALCLSVVILPFLFHNQTALAQTRQSNFGLDEARMVLKVIKEDVSRNYYDPKFHGIDLDAKFKAAEEKLKGAESAGQMMGIIAQTLLDFDDSHLFFLPPPRMNRTEYGWEMQAIGADVYVSAVRPGSEAEARGLKEGDRLISINGFTPDRDNLWKLQYLFRALRPQPALQVVVQSPDGRQRQLDVPAKVKEGKRVMDLTNATEVGDYVRRREEIDHFYHSRWQEFGDDLIIWKMPTFQMDERELNVMLGRAKKYKALILDLRGNGGGYVDICQQLAGAFLEKDVLLAEHKGRKENMKPMKAKKSIYPYSGKLVVLIDSDSASASEILARVIQLEKRGTVIGDRSAGAVMRSRHYSHEISFGAIIPYGVSVTDADVIMSDGKSLEKVGVMPDELLLPTGADLAAKRDPVLARAAALLGVKLDPEKAGALFPIRWLNQ
ncbi:MAG TPA: S41 family peptidase [Blastocatellia bacterium]|nr:S41 family peptidase [Blastocatellia bacterium]